MKHLYAFHSDSNISSISLRPRTLETHLCIIVIAQYFDSLHKLDDSIVNKICSNDHNYNIKITCYVAVYYFVGSSKFGYQTKLFVNFGSSFSVSYSIIQFLHKLKLVHHYLIFMQLTIDKEISLLICKDYIHQSILLLLCFRYIM